MVAGEKCQVEGCTNILKKTEGRICQMHRTRMFRHGSYDLPPNPRSAKWGKPCINPLGYMRITIDGKRVLHHRYIMEQHLGRPLTRKERIHHINGDTTDNRIENLELLSGQREHIKKYHNDVWKKRTVRPEVPPDVIHQIVDRIYMDGGTHSVCFCRRIVYARNLCRKHYHWAYVHKLFRPSKKQVHYNGIHHSSPNENMED